MNARRLYVPTVLGLVAGGGLTVATMSRTWGRAVVTAEGLPDDPVTVAGSDAMGLVSALGLVLLASGLGVLAGSVRVRRLLGVLVTLIAVGCLVWVVVGSGGAVRDALDTAVRESASFTGSNAPGEVEFTAWRFATMACLVLATGCGALVLRYAAAWPTMSSKYDAPGKRAAEADDTDMWKAFDEGRDPTE